MCCIDADGAFTCKTPLASKPESRDRSLSYVGANEINMKKLGCFSVILITGAFLWLVSQIYTSIWPVGEAVVRLPMGDAIARFQTWGGGWGTLPFVLRVDTPHGTISKKLWADWGPASDINLYQTPENWLVGIGGGGDTVIVDVMDTSGPRSVIGDEQYRTNDENWKYLGVAVGDGFIPAESKPECIALLGAGYTKYRKKFQVEHFCVQPIHEHP